jgi:hypothetical protein
MGKIERRVAREVRAMTRREVMVMAIEERITWIQAAAIVGITDRQCVGSSSATNGKATTGSSTSAGVDRGGVGSR